MSKQLTDLFREEALRQTRVALEVVNQVIALKDMIARASSDGGVDATSLGHLRELLEQEVQKLENNEATVAIIGAMKAGKSTTISAVAGAELMPSRDEPMTTFPTIVSHVPSKAVPELRFPLADAFASLSNSVSMQIRDNREATEAALARAEGGPELLVLATELATGSILIPRHATGEADIRQLLTRVNDLSRLAKILDVSRDVIDEALSYDTVPRVEVGFEHLPLIEAAGRLSFVDTPGPDEAADGARLSEISRLQLERASAIILVANYLLEGGQAAEKVRNLLDLLPEGAHERLYVLANKYDQRKQDTGSEEEDDPLAETRCAARELKIRHNIAAKVFGRFGPRAQATGVDRVFLTSARHALIANLARRAAREEGQLPQRGWWPKQFRRDVGAICAAEWQTPPNLGDPVGILAGASKLWRESRFDAPLATAFETAARNASLFLVNSALDKLRGGDLARLFEMLEIRANAFNAKNEELRTLVANLTSDLVRLQGIEKKLHAKLNEYTTRIRSELEKQLEGAMKIVNDNLDGYLKSGDPRISGAEAEKRSQNLITMAINNIKKRFRLEEAPPRARSSSTNISALRDAPDLRGNFQYGARDRIEVGSSDEAIEKSDAIFNAFQKELVRTRETVVMWTEETLVRMSLGAKNQVDSNFNEGWSVAQEHVKEILKVEIAPPDIEIAFNTNILFDKAARAAGHTSSSRSYEVSYDREGAVAGMARFFGGLFEKPSWGRDTRTKYTTDHYIEIAEIRKQIKMQSVKVKNELIAVVDGFVEAVSSSLGDYSQQVRTKIEQVHRIIEEERQNRAGDADVYAELRDAITALAAQASDIKQEATALRSGAQ